MNALVACPFSRPFRLLASVTTLVCLIPIIDGSRPLVADVLTPVNVLATSEFGAVDVFGLGDFSDVFATDLIDGGGLLDLEGTPDDILDDLHDNDLNWTNGWHAGDFPAGLPGGLDLGNRNDGDPFTPPPVAAQRLEFDLGGRFRVSEAYIWQQNQGGFLAGPPLSLDRGVDRFRILVSPLPGGENFVSVGEFQLEAEEGIEPVPAQIISLGAAPVTARRIRFDILSAQSGEEREFVGLAEVRFEGVGAAIPGDFNEDGILTAADIDLLGAAIRSQVGDPRFDLTGDRSVDRKDRDLWVEKLRRTYLGDANLDGEFNSTDFLIVFQAGQYEDGIPGNSGWSTGDWNGDADFDSTDLVVAFQAAGFEKGPRVAAVPEPSVLAMLMAWLIPTIVRRRITSRN